MLYRHGLRHFQYARLLLSGIAVLLASCAKIEDPSLYPVFSVDDIQQPPVKEPVAYKATRNVFWGDLHVHTSLSFDAYTMGVRAGPDDAYTYMKGGTIEHGMGYPVRALRPLDFGAVTDHAEYLGVASAMGDNGAETNRLREIMTTGNPLRITFNFLSTVFSQMGDSETREKTFSQPGMVEVSSNAWQQIVTAAEQHNEPGMFTTFVGYEWTSMPDENNLHRNIIYKNNRVPALPFSAMDSDNPEQLWNALDAQRRQGFEMFAIPHNGNLSNGLMYGSKTLSGAAFSQRYARQRLANEPLSEVFQVKGASETHPLLSPDDEFADFEIYDQLLSKTGGLSQPQGSYVRDALRTGLTISQKLGVNPYQFGVIGSSDSHNASFSAEENNYHGKLPMIDGSAGLRLGLTTLLPKDQNRAARWSAMGLAAVWAEQNSRASLFDAMQRRETYATSGPRITVRFFGGWGYPPQMLDHPNLLEQAYAGGVPMGGVLTGAKNQSIAPVFLVWAAKDVQGANLDRIQIIKAWINKKGQSQEKVINVAVSDNRVIDTASNKIKPLVSTVDSATARYTNTIGATQLSAQWSDPDFNPEQDAFYYARVIEIPTPRFSTFDAVTLGVAPPEPISLQERAVTSAIWYQSTL